jgi:hypothetical protein
MIGHQHVGVNGKIVFASSLREPGDVLRVIRIAEEYRLTIVPALDHMQRLTLEKKPPAPRHARSTGDPLRSWQRRRELQL